MKVLTTARQKGKTTRAIEYAHKTKAVIVCINCQRVRDIQKIAKDMGFEINKPITFFKLLSPEIRCQPHPKVIIDDLDIMFDQMFKNVEVLMVTATGEKL